jgi:hypothetical protein
VGVDEARDRQHAATVDDPVSAEEIVGRHDLVDPIASNKNVSISEDLVSVVLAPQDIDRFEEQ